MIGRGHELEQLKATEYERIRHRRESFKCHSRTTKGLQLTLVTPVGLKRNKYWGNVQRVVTLDDLFGTASPVPLQRL